MSIYLYLKTHTVTGLKYLGKTIKKDPHKYPGSGIHWVRHLKKHGYTYTTEIIRVCHSTDELKEWGIYYSKLWNIVESDEWANLKEEAGDAGSPGQSTRDKISAAGKGRTHSAETKLKMSTADRSSYTRTAPVSDATREKLSAALRGKPGRGAGVKWTDEQKLALSIRRQGQKCPTKGMSRVYREDGSFYFKAK